MKGNTSQQISKTASWEVALGDTLDRTSHLGRTSNLYRQDVHVPPVNAKQLETHVTYMHELGADILRTIFSDEHEFQARQSRQQKRNRKVINSIRRRVKVEDFDDGGISVAIEQDWDTSGWDEPLIEGGFEALLFLFYDLPPSMTVTTEKKDRALQMISKLLDRHKEAQDYLRRNMETILGQAATRTIRNGRSAGQLDLLLVINRVKDRVLIELSNFSFASRMMGMLLQEMRLAAVLIQHSYRVRKAKLRLQKSMSGSTYFGTDREVYYRQLGVINARSSELRRAWRELRSHHPTTHAQTIGGLRGPIHLTTVHTQTCLQIVLPMISSVSGSYTHSNREDVVRSNGLILLSSLLGCVSGPFAIPSSRILAEVSHVPESYLPLLHAGCLDSAVRFLRYLRIMKGVGNDIIPGGDHGSFDSTLSQAYLSTMEVVQNTVLHAAGVYRGRHGYDYHRTAQTGREAIDYRSFAHQLSTYDYKRSETGVVLPLLSPLPLLRELSTVILNVKQASIIISALKTILYLTSSDCTDRLFNEVIALAGKLMIKLVELLHHSNDTIGDITLAIFLQLTAFNRHRSALLGLSIHRYLIPLNQKVDVLLQLDTQKGKKQHVNESKSKLRGLHRSMLLAAALSRLGDWRPYNPETLLHTIQYDPTYLPQAALSDLLRTAKGQGYNGHNHALTIADMTLLPSQYTYPGCIDMSRAISGLGGNDLSNYCFHPEEKYYYEKLPLHEASAVCIVLEAMSTYAVTARQTFRRELIHFLAKSLFLCRCLFIGPALYDRQVCVLLSGVKSAFVCLGQVATAIQENAIMAQQLFEEVNHTELLSTCLFYLGTLSKFSEGLEKFTLQLQKHVGISCLAFLTRYAAAVNRWDGSMTQSHHYNIGGDSNSGSIGVKVSIESLFPPGRAVVKLLQDLRTIYKDDSAATAATQQSSSSAVTAASRALIQQANRETFLEVLDSMCVLLMEITKPPAGAVAALQEWSVQSALKRYMPPPLSGLPDVNAGFQRSSITNGAHQRQNSGGSGGGGSGGSRSRLPINTSISSNIGAIGTSFSSRASRNLRQRSRSRSNSPNNSGLLADDDNGTRQRRVELMELPPSFFELCANLCRLKDGSSFCFTEGFLRRALDKLGLLHQRLVESRAPRGAIAPSFRWDKRKADFTGCLRLIGATAGFHHAKYGNANDLILSELHDVVMVCKTLLQLKIRRTEEVVLVAYETLASLAKDTFRINSYLERHDILEVIRNELLILDQFPERGAAAAVELLHFACLGITSPYLVKKIPQLREPLIKVSRLFPRLDEPVRRTNWTLTKSQMIYRSTVDSSLALDAFDEAIYDDGISKKEIESFIRNGSPLLSRNSTPRLQGVGILSRTNSTAAGGEMINSNGLLPLSPIPAARGNSSSSSGFENIAITNKASSSSSRPGSASSFSTAGAVAAVAVSRGGKQLHRQLLKGSIDEANNTMVTKGSGMAASSSIIPMRKSLDLDASPAPAVKKDKKLFAEEDNEVAILIDSPGQYSHCGVTSCGSLRIPHPQHMHASNDGGGRDLDHNSHRKLSSDQALQLSKSLDLKAVVGNDKLPISRLSAREPGLQELIAVRKGKAGFSEIQKIKLEYPKPRHHNTYNKRSSGERHENSVGMMMSLFVKDLPDLMLTRPAKKGV